MNVWKKMNLILHLTLIGCLFFSLTPEAWCFIIQAHQFPNFNDFNVLIQKVHEPSWTIGYRYGSECKPGDKQNDKALQEAITTVLRTWLKPLRDMKPARPIVDVFHFQLQEDFTGDKFENLAGKLAVDVRVTFQCVSSFSYALMSATPPDLFIRRGTKINPALLYSLTHEVGHAFGLQDTYVSTTHPSTGGLAQTVGKQPSSIMAIMSGVAPQRQYPYLKEDDKRAIIHLYKVFYEDLDHEDCFFPDYVYEQEPRSCRGCRPKYPLIFEIKYNSPIYVLELLDEDPTIDVNTQDPTGMTALHHAVALDHEAVVKRLLEHKDIDPSLRDKQGRTALDIAREADLTEIIALLPADIPPQTVEDVNGDGIVNILDLVMVATHFGKQGKNKADVEGNRVVDIRDLVKVASLLQ